MAQDPIWTKCPHLPGGSCPQLNLDAGLMAGGGSPWPETTQDLALERLSQACPKCALRPDKEE